MMTAAADKQMTILIVEDSPIYREALEGNLQSHPHLFHIIGSTDRREQALELVEQHVPDVALLDLILFRERWSGIEMIRDVRKISPSTQVVVLTAHFEDDLIFEAIRAGAVTYLLKDNITGDYLIDILTQVADGDPPLDPEIARRLYDFFQSPEGSRTQISDMSRLTKREQEVLGLVAQSKSNQEIADDLVIALKTVKTHVSNILSKLHLSNRTELKWWYQHQRAGKYLDSEDS